MKTKESGSSKVRHRVNDILKLTQKEDWGHCPGKDNLADLGTRGMTAAKLEKSDLWWHGPEWIRGPKEDWPERQEVEETPESTKKLKKAVVSTVKVSDVVSTENVIGVRRYSSKEKLVRVTAFVLRFAHAELQG